VMQGHTPLPFSSPPWAWLPSWEEGTTMTCDCRLLLRCKWDGWLFFYFTHNNDRYLPMFRRNLSVPSSSSSVLNWGKGLIMAWSAKIFCLFNLVICIVYDWFWKIYLRYYFCYCPLTLSLRTEGGGGLVGVEPPPPIPKVWKSGPQKSLKNQK
jgi:hypothetical protein